MRRKRIQITEAQQQALLTARAEGREITATARELGIDAKRAHNWLYLHRQREGGESPPARKISPERPTFTQEEAEGLRRLLGQQERKGEIAAQRTGKTELCRVDAGLLGQARQHAKQHRLNLSELVSNSLASYLSAVTSKAGG